MSPIHSKATDRLFEVILGLQTVEECYDFFEDVCTIKEIQDMTQRLEVALLLHGGMNYQDISKQTGVSTATISRVSKCLNYGNGGYRAAIRKLNQTENYDENSAD